MKNAFGLHLIDYMTEILKQKESEGTDFKLAAGTLDASAKIYSARVDVIHTDTYKVLGGLGKDVAPTNNMDSSEEEASTAPEAAKRALKKSKRSFKTIAQDVSSIDRPEASHRCEVDPMFQRTAAAFDQCSTAGVFLSRTHTSGCQSELLFDSKLVPLPAAATLTAPSTEPVAAAGLKALLEKCLEKRPICSSLAGFQFTKWDAESHDESVSALLEKFKRSDEVFDVNGEVDIDLEESAPALPESSFCSDSPRGAARSQLGEFQENLNTFGTTDQSYRGKVLSLEEGDIGILSLHLSMKPGEYSYFSPSTLSLWAGPEHWRFKPHHRATAQIPGQSKSRSAKKPFEIGFDESIDFNRDFCETKAPVTLARSLQDSNNSKSTTLPPDFNYDPGNIFQMFLKPDIKISRMLAAGSSLEPRAGIGDYDYNNPNDTSNFCPALQAADSDDDNDFAHCTGQAEGFNLPAYPEGQGAELSRVNLTTYGELNLIPEPQKVNKLRIQYAKTAKKIDIKHLKKNMWGLLTEKKDAAEEEDAEEEEDKSVVAGEKTLSSITQELHQRLPAQMAQELSVPLAFACLLHLANEKNLKLEGREDLSDVIITQDKTKLDQLDQLGPAGIIQPLNQDHSPLTMTTAPRPGPQPLNQDHSPLTMTTAPRP
ncbi:condensin complex subunit 2 [Indicator indicator]|uniref:condensin complex subunit 2 n=1 Tax=Indicator indicator TaxID=1002788 RepID=UPI0023DE9002|nr:condensin complex subunit 2 [Indicator indicator]